ncbi:AAA family ATPase [Clostridioides sp. ES-S-0049-02]|uniref:McrB family protein n=1 Tax=Clostridioides sp. ES-S-0049-02 TaxID=2770778 RepID=UPI001D1214CA|nr:AAA family ATPase [Clostridioides sp. ES-S-0049-02]
MSENINVTEYWLMEEFFYQETDTPQIFKEESIIALGFDIKINLKKVLNMGKKSEKYINENCNDKDFIKKFISVKKGDYFLYKAYQNVEEKIKYSVLIGIVEESFENGYELSHILGHTLPIKWMYTFDTVLNCKIYTSEFYKLNNEDINTYLDIIKLQHNKSLKKRIEENDNNKWYLKNYYYIDVDKCVENEELFIQPTNLEQLENLKNINTDDYILVYNSEKVSYENDHTMKSLFGVCQVKEGFDKDKITTSEGGCFLPVEWIENEKENIDGNAWVIFENNNLVEKYIKRCINKIPLNTILYGPPGTGKTYNAKQIVYNLINETSLKNNDCTSYVDYKNNVEFCTFHQSYGYEEFIEGLKSDGEGNFKPEDGILKEISIEACYDGLKLEKKLNLELEKDTLTIEDVKARKKMLVLDNIEDVENFNFEESENYVLIIDEINRGNISKIFGELITLLEDDKRLTKSNQTIVKLPYSKERFSLPPNLYIIGTMNTSDKSIALLDIALRRRFAFEEIMPDYDLLSVVDGIDVKNMLYTINKRIEFLYDRDHVIGQAYLLNVENIDDIVAIFRKKIIPLLQEYFYYDSEKVGLILGGIGKNEKDKYIVYKEEITASKLFKNNNSSIMESKVNYCIKRNISIEELKNIYE